MTEVPTNDEIREACGRFDPNGPYAADTRVVYRVSDAPPRIERFGDLPSYISLRFIYGSVTPEAECLVAIRERAFRGAWG